LEPGDILFADGSDEDELPYDHIGIAVAPAPLDKLRKFGNLPTHAP
jgi:hypothetical protein